MSSVPPIWGWGWDNPTQFMVGQNDKVSFGGVHVPRDLGSTCTPGFSIRPVSPSFWAGGTRDLGSTCTPGFGTPRLLLAHSQMVSKHKLPVN